MTSRRWIILGTLFIARTVMGFQFQTVVGASASLRADLGIGLGELGILVGAYMLPGIVVAIPGGTIGRRFGEKRIAVLGLVLMALGGTLTAVSGDVATATAGRLLAGIGAVTLNVLLASMVAEWFPGARLVTAMSVLVTSWPAGIGIVLVIGPAIAEQAGWPAIMWLSVIASLTAGALVGLVYRRPSTADTQPAVVTRQPLTGRDFRIATWSGQVWALYNVGYILVVSFMPALLLGDGASPGTAGLVTSLATWLLIVTVPLGGMLVDRLGHNVLIMQVCFAAMAATMAAAAVVPVAIAIVIVIGVVAGPPAGAIMALPAGALRPAIRTQGMGIYFTWYYVAMAVLPPVAGWLGDRTGSASAPLVFGAVVMIAAMASLVVFRRYASGVPTGAAR